MEPFQAEKLSVTRVDNRWAISTPDRPLLFFGDKAGCTACHTISGTAAQSAGGPNLTHFASRECFAGCSLTRTDANIDRWLTDPAAVKPGSFMPNYHLTQDEKDALVAYLQSLK
jgi:cytochrome c oxidase subunit 2